MLAGCAGTVIVEFQLAPSVTRHTAAGTSIAEAADAFSEPPLPAGISVAFPAPRYRGNGFMWSIGVSAYGIGGNFINKRPRVLCLRFDQAHIASNHHPTDIPLHVRYMRLNARERTESTGSNRPGSHAVHLPSPLCFAPNVASSFAVWPLLRDLYPSGHMFDVQWPERLPQLTETGVGQWFRLTLPVDYGDERETIEITLTAKDSRARVSYY